MYALNAQSGNELGLEIRHGRCSSKSSPAVADGVVYVGSRDGFLYALDAATWRSGMELRDRRRHSVLALAVSGDKVYVGSLDGNVYAFSEVIPR